MPLGALFHKITCRLLVAYIGKAVPVYVQARNMTYATPEHAAVEKWVTVETVMKQTGQCINMLSTFKSWK